MPNSWSLAEGRPYTMVKASTLSLWDKAVCTLTARLDATEIDELLGFKDKGKNMSLQEASYYKKAIVALKLAKEPLKLITFSYYSYEAYMDFGFPHIFISRETFGWNPQQAKVHIVRDYFSQSEWDLIVEVLRPNPRHLFEIYTLKQSNYYQALMNDIESTFEDIIDAYLAYLQVT
ncbi:hypothetical protein L2E82_04879 [Cichorium intybus]|uniref:Uncharacterized protein n=1 Tax=Cichorium intybus TaxID=13427 RepID=A0ACB9H6Z4_CICIN|nr:hypothetical protein L2E82_04879 [Cichorium intybus]